jgi:hypothetical protein
MNDEISVSAGKPRALETILLGGLAVGVLDFLDASIFFTLYYDIPLQRVWHGVAAGIYGRDAARAGGWNTALVGILLHFVVAFGVATVYYFASRNIPLMIRRPIITGLIYGVLVHFVMQYVVIPLSAIGTPAPITLWPFVNSVVGHALLVGLPVALIAAWSAKRATEQTLK